MSDLSNRNFEITDARGGAALGVRVVTRAVETEIVGKTEEGSLKIRLKASPAGDPAANEELVHFLAEKLGVSTDKVEVVAGENSRDKILSIADLTAEMLEAKLIDE